MIQLINERCQSITEGTELGIGDDAAILKPNQKLVVSTDTLVAGVHFKNSDLPQGIGHKALAVNISDLAAMGATPKWALLNLTLPKIDQNWVEDFVSGFADLLTTHKMQLVGGDTTQGPLSITVTVMGEAEQTIRRNTAQVDDLIVVSGEIGSAAYALTHPKCKDVLKQQLHRPEPRTDIAQQVKGYATAMLDISDGLMADLNHICEASGVGAVIELNQIPVHQIVKKAKHWQQYVLAGGDDYQLCFTIKAEDEELLPPDCHIIGQIIHGQGIMVLHNHQPIETHVTGYQHFEYES